MDAFLVIITITGIIVSLILIGLILSYDGNVDD